ncbi:hypothetical protein ACFCXT_30530 [Streptomyces vinaceus]|uniref:hypothetical protein n=1 Tax=Streptomyces vinaceus TaxID=1960 RepID=UPI0035E14C99
MSFMHRRLRRPFPATGEPVIPDHDIRAAFSSSLFRFEQLAREFTDESLGLERMVLHSQEPGQNASTHTFRAPESTMTRQEIWRVKFLLLDILYGEPSSAMTRISCDLTSDHGQLRPAWDLAHRFHDAQYTGSRYPVRTADVVHGAVASYGLDCFRPNLAKCLALWTGLPSSERALLSADVTGVLDAVITRLHALEASYSAVEDSSWALVRYEGYVR